MVITHAEWLNTKKCQTGQLAIKSSIYFETKCDKNTSRQLNIIRVLLKFNVWTKLNIDS